MYTYIYCLELRLLLEIPHLTWHSHLYVHTIRGLLAWQSKQSGTVFNPYAPSNKTSTTAASYRKHKMEKCRKYERRVLDAEHGSFTTLVFSTSGGWGPSATVTFRRLASLISNKVSQLYGATLGFIRCKIAFSLIDLAVMCLRGARSSIHNPSRNLNLHSQPLDLIANEARWSV